MAGVSPVPDDFDAARFRRLTTASGACFGGFLALVSSATFGWFGRPQWWWLVMLGLFGSGLWYAHREVGLMRSQLLSHVEPDGGSAVETLPSRATTRLERYCGYCQAPVRQGVAFCTSCGQHLGAHGGHFE